MPQDSHPYRSVLYMPGSRPRALEKARSLPADALILDLEDAVAPAEKENARELVAKAVEDGGYGSRKLIVRVNGFDTAWGEADLARAARAQPDAILLPKVESPADIARAALLMADAGAEERVRIWAMMETPRGALNALAIADSHPRLEGFVLGTNDLVKDLGAAHTPDRLPLVASLGLCLLAARAAGLVCVDGVYNAFQDAEGLRAACLQGRDMGFDGKTLIHPGQVEPCNAAFSPSVAEVEEAEGIVAAWRDGQGSGVVTVNGKMIERLHVDIAERVLAIHAAVAN